MGRAKRKGRKQDEEEDSTQPAESDTQPAGDFLENREITNGEGVRNALLSDGVILNEINYFGDTQLVGDPIDGDVKTQLACYANSPAYPSMDHDTGIRTQLVDEPENVDYLEPPDNDNDGTEIIVSLSDEGGSFDCQHFACQNGNTERHVTEYSEGMVALNIDEKMTPASRSLSEHMDKNFVDSDASTEDENNLDSGSAEVNSAFVHITPLNIASNKTQAEPDPETHAFEAGLEQKEVWNGFRGKEELENSKAQNLSKEDTGNTLPFNRVGKTVEEVTSLHVHMIEQPSELSYLCSQEPGELSQASALGIVDKLLDLDDIKLFPEDGPRKNVEVKLSSVSGAKGPQSLARSQDRKNPIQSIGTFDWIDSREDEGGGEFFTKRREHFFGSGKERKLFTEPCRSKKQSTRKAESLAKGSQDNQGRLVKDHDSIRDVTRSDFRVGLFCSKLSIHFEQVDKSKIKRNLLSNLNEQERAQRLEQPPEPAKDSGTMFNDVGIDTQMAAEAMQALGHGSPAIKVGEDFPSKKQMVDNDTTDCSRKMPDKLVVKNARMRRFAKGSHDVVNSADAKKDACTKFSEFLERGEESDKTYGSTGSVLDRGRLTEPVGHCTRNQVAKAGHKSHYVLRNQKEGISDQIGGRTPRRTRSSLSAGTSIKKRQVSASTAPPQCRGSGRVEKGSRERNSRSSSQNKRAKICGDTSVYDKEACVKRMETGAALTVKATKRSVCPSSSAPSCKQTSRCLNTGVLDDDANRSCFPYDGDRTHSSRHSYSGGSTFRKPKKDLTAQKDRTVDTIHVGDCLESDVLVQKMPSTFHVPHIPNSPHHMSTTEALQNNIVEINSLVCATPLKSFSAVSPSSKMNGATQSYKRSSSMSPLTRELIRLDAINPELSPVLKDVARQKKDISNVRVLFSHHLGEDIIKQQKKILARLGISMASSALEATHFIADKFIRTRNMLESIALGKPVVTPSWLESCGQACCFIDEKKYILRDAKKEREIGFSMPASLACAKEKPLLQGSRVLVTQNVKPSKDLIIALVKATHGLVTERIGRSAREDLLVISCEEDRSICMPFLQIGARAYSAELILNGIVIQKLEFDRHLLFMDDKRTRSSRVLRS